MNRKKAYNVMKYSHGPEVGFVATEVVVELFVVAFVLTEVEVERLVVVVVLDVTTELVPVRHCASGFLELRT
jgi:hypothetical protein